MELGNGCSRVMDPVPGQGPVCQTHGLGREMGRGEGLQRFMGFFGEADLGASGDALGRHRHSWRTP